VYSVTVGIDTIKIASVQESMPLPVANEASRAKSACAEALIFHVLLDVAVDEYTEWRNHG
jgi:hypothetical protein